MIEKRIDQNFQSLFEKYGYTPENKTSKSLFEQLDDCDKLDRVSLNESKKVQKNVKLNESQSKRTAKDLTKELQQKVDNDIKKYNKITSDTKLSIESCGYKVVKNKVVVDQSAKDLADKRTKNESIYGGKALSKEEVVNKLSGNVKDECLIEESEADDELIPNEVEDSVEEVEDAAEDIEEVTDDCCDITAKLQELIDDAEVNEKTEISLDDLKALVNECSCEDEVEDESGIEAEDDEQEITDESLITEADDPNSMDRFDFIALTGMPGSGNVAKAKRALEQAGVKFKMVTYSDIVNTAKQVGNNTETYRQNLRQEMSQKQ